MANQFMCNVKLDQMMYNLFTQLAEFHNILAYICVCYNIVFDLNNKNNLY